MTSTGTRLAQLDAKATATPLEDFERLLSIANEMKTIAPTSPKGYLLAGRVYLKKDDLEAALSTYKSGLELVPSIVSSYALLERNRRAVEAEIKRREEPPAHKVKKTGTFAYSIISLIFSHLSLADLIKCTTVCKPWFQFIIQWPWFWHFVKMQVPQLDHESLHAYLMRQGGDIKFVGIDHEPLIPNTLSFVLVLQEYYYPVKLLDIENVLLHRVPTVFLDDLQSQPLRSIQFNNVILSSSTSLSDIIVGCKHANRFVYRGALDSDRNCRHTSEENLNSASLIDINVTFGITHLEISFGEEQSIDQDIGKTLIGIIRKCPSLEHLVLDSCDSIPHGEVISVVNEACPRIRNLIINRGGRMPKTILDEEWSCQEANGKTHGLRRFVLAGNDEYNATSDDVIRILKNHRQTIELLYLHHDGQVVTPEFLYQLAYLGDMLSNLRELWIYTRLIDYDTHQPSTSFAEALGTLVFHCPSLEALAVIDQTVEPEIPLVTDQVLQSLVLRCNKLRFLRINGFRGFDAKSLFQLATVPHTQVDTLDLSFMHRDIAKVIHQWTTVKNLVIRMNRKIDHASVARLDTILRERGGKLHRK